MEDVIGKIIRTLRCQSRHLELVISKYVSSNWYDHVRFQHTMGRKLDYKNPVYLNDKLMWLNKYDTNPLKSLCADKVRVHDYLKDKGLETYAVPLLTVWNSADEIELDQLPNQFVLKCNHGCGYNIIVANKSSLDIVETREKLNRWLKEDYGKVCNEYHYSHIQPLVFAEQYIPSFSGGIIDYKIHCINGEAKWFLVCTERDCTGHPKLSAYSLDWEPLGCLKTPNVTPINKPKYLKEMIEIATKIAVDFPFVRVDLYETEERIYIGELTFTPQGNTISYYKDEFLYEQGLKLQLPK